MCEGLLTRGRKSRGCRGKESKRRSRNKWLLKIGAAYAHHEVKKHCGLGATSCAQRSAHRVTGTAGAATGKSWSGITSREAKRNNIAPRPTECAESALTGAADSAHRGEDATTMAVVMAGDAVVGQRGDSNLPTPADKVDGENGKKEVKETTTSPTVVLIALVLWWSSSWCVVSGMSLVAAAAATLWLDRQLNEWLADGETGIMHMAAVKRLLTGLKRPRLTHRRKAEIERAWRRVFRVMIERGLAGELAQCKLQARQLKAQLSKAQGSLEQIESRHAKEINRLKNGRSSVIAKAKERHFLDGRLEGLREALPVERENNELRGKLAQQAAEFNDKLLKFQQQLQELRAVQASRVATVAAVVPGTNELDLATWLMVGLPAKCWRFRSDYLWDNMGEHIQDRAIELGFNKRTWNRLIGSQLKVQRASDAIDSGICAYPGHGQKMEPRPGEVGFP